MTKTCTRQPNKQKSNNKSNRPAPDGDTKPKLSKVQKARQDRRIKQALVKAKKEQRLAKHTEQKERSKQRRKKRSE